MMVGTYANTWLA